MDGLFIPDKRKRAYFPAGCNKDSPSDFFAVVLFCFTSLYARQKEAIIFISRAIKRLTNEPKKGILNVLGVKETA